MFCINDRVLVKLKDKKKLRGIIIGIDFFENAIDYLVELSNEMIIRVSFYDLVAY